SQRPKPAVASSVQKLRSSRPVKPYHTSSLDDELDLYSRSCSTSVAFSDLHPLLPTRQYRTCSSFHF
ncbi:hypothetical protein GBA52_023043, partial [Prunus armeniaca]